MKTKFTLLIATFVGTVCFGVTPPSLTITKKSASELVSRFSEKAWSQGASECEQFSQDHSVSEWIDGKLKADGEVEVFREKAILPKTFFKVVEVKIGGKSLDHVALLDDVAATESPRPSFLLDVGRGTEKDLTSVKVVDDRVWLAEESDLIPDPILLGFEAKLKKASAVLVYGIHQAATNPTWLSRYFMGQVPVPVIRISYEDGSRLKRELQSQPIETSIGIKSDNHIHNFNDFFVRVGGKSPAVDLLFDYKECSQASLAVALIELIQAAHYNINLTSFTLTANAESFQQNHPDYYKSVVQRLQVSAPDATTIKSFLRKWLSLEASPDKALPLVQFNNNLEKMTRDLREIADLGSVNGLKESLRKFAALPIMRRQALAFHLQSHGILDEFSSLILNVKNLQQMHYEIERGHWAKAQQLQRALPDFRWIDNINADSLADYFKTGSRMPVVDPKVHSLLKGGKQNIDQILPLLESEIDRLQGLLSKDISSLSKDLAGPS